jgi:hypothetical protein
MPLKNQRARSTKGWKSISAKKETYQESNGKGKDSKGKGKNNTDEEHDHASNVEVTKRRVQSLSDLVLHRLSSHQRCVHLAVNANLSDDSRHWLVLI